MPRAAVCGLVTILVVLPGAILVRDARSQCLYMRQADTDVLAAILTAADSRAFCRVISSVQDVLRQILLGRPDSSAPRPGRIPRVIRSLAALRLPLVDLLSGAQGIKSRKARRPAFLTSAYATRTMTANVSQMDNGLKNADDLLRGIFSHMGNVGLYEAGLPRPLVMYDLVPMEPGMTPHCPLVASMAPLRVIQSMHSRSGA